MMQKTIITGKYAERSWSREGGSVVMSQLCSFLSFAILFSLPSRQ